MLRIVVVMAALLAAASGSSLPASAELERPSRPAALAPVREIAVTFDDLPAASVARGDLDSLEALTDRLLSHFVRSRVPVVGFVNEGKLDMDGDGLEARRRRIGLLDKWLEAGFELGNHTFSHRSLNDVSLREFQEDVVRGEPATAALMSRRGRALRYFRHPFLHVGLDLDKRQAFEAWLKTRGYRVAPVTIDNDDYVFAAVYAAALRAGDTTTAARTAEAYLAYMASVFEFNEALSETLFSRSIRFVLLLHANELNADHAGRLFDRLTSRGYSFVTIDQALDDPAYASTDTYVGRFGVSWMHHWELSMGRKRTGSPDPPSWVGEAYEKARR